MRKLILVILILFSLFTNSQTEKIEDNFKILNSDIHDSLKYRASIQLGEYFQNKNSDSALFYHKMSVEFSKKLKDPLLEAEGLRNIAWDLYIVGEYDEAYKTNEEGLAITQQFIGSNTDHDRLKQAFQIQSGLLSSIGVLFMSQSEYSQALDYFNKALLIAFKSGNKQIQSKIYGNIGIVYSEQADYSNALLYFNKALQLNTVLKNRKGQATNIGNIGNVYSDQGNYAIALGYYFKALKITEELGDKRASAINLANIGNIFYNLNNYKGAIENVSKAYALNLELGNKLNQANNLGYLGNIYRKLENYPHALDNFKKALQISKEIEHKSGMASIYGNMGSVYCDKKEYPNALEYYFMALKIDEEVADKKDQCINLGNIGYTYFLVRNYTEAEKYLKKSYDIAVQIGSLDDIQSAHKHLSDLFEKTGKAELSLKHYKLYIQFRDSIFNEENMHLSLQQEFKFNYDKKATADSVAFAKQSLIKNTELARQKAEIKAKRLQQYFLYGGLMMLVVFSIFIYNRFKITQKQKHIIEDQNLVLETKNTIIEEKQKEIIDSINYAKRIQYTLLAHEDFLKVNIPEHFVFFNPKDIVSGDFYWATKKGDKFYLAVCDSTGHGVPGAFMSLLNIGFLSEAINEKGIGKPNEVFDFVRQRLIDNISKEGQKDGFDGILVCIDKNNNEITYAAANNRPVLLSNNVFSELSTDRMPVGMGERTDGFNLYSIKAAKNDTLYLYTDGFADQFGGPKGKKFMYKRLNELLVTNSNKPTAEQKNILQNAFEVWRGGLEQVDDVCIIGIRL